MELITSLQNQKVKDVVALQAHASVRRRQGLFVVEGCREVDRCMAAGWQFHTLFVCPEIAGDFWAENARRFCQMQTYQVTEAVYAKMAYRGGTEGVIALVRSDFRPGLQDVALSASPLVVVVEAVEKPGNIGAMLRTADATGVEAFIICDPRADVYSPNLIRASLGGVFSRNVVVCSSQEASDWLKQKGIQILTAQLQDSTLYYETDMTGPTALVFGSEDEGLTQYWREVSDKKIRIPMLGKVDSLNVSASMAVLCYEAVRQRYARDVL